MDSDAHTPLAGPLDLEPPLEGPGKGAAGGRARIAPNDLGARGGARGVCGQPRRVARQGKLPADGTHEQDERNGGQELDARLTAF